MRRVDPHYLSRRACRICEWPEYIENGTDTECAPHRHHGLHRGMQVGCMEECKSVLPQCLRRIGGSQVDGYTQRLQDVA